HRRKASKRISGPEAKHLVLDEQLRKIDGYAVAHQLVRLIPASKFCRAIPQDRVCLRRLGCDLGCSKVGSDLAIGIASLQFRIVGIDQALDDWAAQERQYCHPHVRPPSAATVAAR